MSSVPQGPKRAVNLTVSADLLAQGRAASFNLSALLELALLAELTRMKGIRWCEENAVAVVAYNELVERCGTFSEGGGSL